MAFGPQYSALYDAMYETKDYVAEAAFVLEQLDAHLPKSGGRVLDLGCGTGLHAIEMARRGRTVVGLDLSGSMIARAHERRGQLPAELAGRLSFAVKDLRAAAEPGPFDAVVSLFHVLCYMTDATMLSEGFAAARRHLQPGGGFLFDFWYADAVLNDPPQPRRRGVDHGGKRITRVTTPRWEPDRSLVHVTYDMFEDDAERPMSTETHSVRYFALDELEDQLRLAGFSVVRFGEWLSNAPPSRDSFGVYCLATAV
jgi:SAM-dependent methyltransferase